MVVALCSLAAEAELAAALTGIYCILQYLLILIWHVGVLSGMQAHLSLSLPPMRALGMAAAEIVTGLANTQHKLSFEFDRTPEIQVSAMSITTIEAQMSQELYLLAQCRQRPASEDSSVAETQPAAVESTGKYNMIRHYHTITMPSRPGRQDQDRLPGASHQSTTP